jgi:hypothetical protein
MYGQLPASFYPPMLRSTVLACAAAGSYKSAPLPRAARARPCETCVRRPAHSRPACERAPNWCTGLRWPPSALGPPPQRGGVRKSGDARRVRPAQDTTRWSCNTCALARRPFSCTSCGRRSQRALANTTCTRAGACSAVSPPARGRVRAAPCGAVRASARTSAHHPHHLERTRARALTTCTTSCRWWRWPPPARGRVRAAPSGAVRASARTRSVGTRT